MALVFHVSALRLPPPLPPPARPAAAPRARPPALTAPPPAGARSLAHICANCAAVRFALSASAVLRVRHALLIDHGKAAPHRAHDAGPPRAAGSDELHADGTKPLDSSTRRPCAAAAADADMGEAASPVLTAVDDDWDAMLREELDCFSPHLPPTLRATAEVELDGFLKNA